MVIGDGAGRARDGGLWYATLLFVLLLVLPATYLSYAQWRTMQSDRDEAIAALPLEISDSSERLVLAIKERYDELLHVEEERPFWHFRDEYRPISSLGTDFALIPSPLVDAPLQAGVQAHFAYTLDEGRDAMVHLFLGAGVAPEMRDALAQDHLRAAEELVERDWDALSLITPEELVNLSWIETLTPTVAGLMSARSERIPLPHAAVNLSKETDIDCLRDNLPVLEDLQEHEVVTLSTAYRVRSLLDSSLTERIVATRRVIIDSPEGLTGALPDCFQEASYGTTLVQGFFLDRAWLLEELPERMASTTIPAELTFERSVSEDTPLPLGVVRTERSLYKELDIELVEAPFAPDDDVLIVSSDTKEIEALYTRRWEQFLATAVILTGALGTGLFLLLRSVRASVRDATRTRNFVAAVSHELKTPVAALRLYGEMLSEGWAKDEAKREEYHQRIVRESERLELLVNRVMLKTRLETTAVTPVATDLCALLSELVPELNAGRDDITLVTDPETPRALADPEGVRSILENLVDNARKYAKSSTADPVEVTLSEKGGLPQLTISDRGPGVPQEERDRIFDAFYRAGDEERRAAQGIGLGLHLAALHASAIGAELDVRDRPGGGAAFSVSFRRG